MVYRIREGGSPRRILVTGSRDWDDHQTIYRAFIEYISEHAEMGLDSDGEPVDYLVFDWVVVDGACPTGADDIAHEYAVCNFMQTERHPADWKKYGKAAGFRRNAEMVGMGADVCLAFIKNGSKGATHTADLAEKAGIEVRRFLAD